MLVAVLLPGLSWSGAGEQSDEDCCSSFVVDDPSVDQVVQIGVVPERRRFDVEMFQTRAGSCVKLIFKNTGDTRLSLVILAAGERAADEIAREALRLQAAGAAGASLREDERVLACTEALDRFEAEAIVFTAPDEPGDYIYLSPLPGRAPMRGIMRVVARGSAETE